MALVGMMASGKSSVGRALARELGVGFIDTDAEIERRAEQTIPQIFGAHGEVYFRALERQEVERVPTHPDCVLAVGGGMFVGTENIEDLRANAFCVWLRASVDTLLWRVGDDPGDHGLSDPRRSAEQDAETFAAGHLAIEAPLVEYHVSKAGLDNDLFEGI